MPEPSDPLPPRSTPPAPAAGGAWAGEPQALAGGRGWPLAATRAGTLAVTLVVLAAAGLALRPLEGPAWEDFHRREPALSLSSLEGALGQGISLGVLGGFRALVANLLWVQANFYWEREDDSLTPATVKLVVGIDPRPTYFWLNAARIIGYDIPVWRIERAGGFDAVPLAVQEQLHRRQAGEALALLERALAFHPHHTAILTEIAQLHQRKLKDLDAAAAWYKRAWEAEGAYYTGRIHAELLRLAGRKEEAYAFLREMYPGLPEDDPNALRWVVWDRIRELEEELGVPPLLRMPGERPPMILDDGAGSGAGGGSGGAGAHHGHTH